MNWTLIALVMVYGVMAGVAGFTICRATHRQKGLDVDSFIITYGPTPAGKK